MTGQAKGSAPKGSKVWDARTGHPNRYDHADDQITDEYLFVGDTITTTFTGNLSYIPLKPGSVQITDGTLISVDNGNGVLSNALTNMTSGSIDYVSGAYSITFGVAPGTSYSITATYFMDIEANANLQQIDFQISSTPIHAKERKLRGRWSTEAAQALEALHGLNAESQVSTAIANELQFGLNLRLAA